MKSLPFHDALADCSRLAGKVPQAECLPEGEIPVIGQGKQAIEGFTNDGSHTFRGDLPAILFGDHTAVFKFIDRPFARGADGTKLFKPRRDDLDAKFAWHFLQTIRLPKTGYDRKAKYLEDINIPIPPLQEQRRIAAILDKAANISAIQARAEGLRLAIKRSLFEDSFHLQNQAAVTIGSGLLPHWKGWGWQLLTDVARLASGHTPDRSNKAYWGGDIPWITLGDIRELDGRLASHTKEMTTKEGIANSSAVLLPKGTVCFSRTASVGFSTVMGKAMSTSQDFVNWVCGPDLLPEYLMHALIFSRPRLKGLSTGSTHKTIYFSTVEQLRVLLPPVSIQARFCELIRKVDLMQLSESIELINRLKQSLAAEFFQGHH